MLLFEIRDCQLLNFECFGCTHKVIDPIDTRFEGTLRIHHLKCTLAWFTVLFHQMTPLHLAAERGRFQMVGYLVDQKADINVKDKDGVSGTILLNLVLLMWF